MSLQNASFTLIFSLLNLIKYDGSKYVDLQLLVVVSLLTFNMLTIVIQIVVYC